VNVSGPTYSILSVRPSHLDGSMERVPTRRASGLSPFVVGTVELDGFDSGRIPEVRL
jgi:hypothetical protein